MSSSVVGLMDLNGGSTTGRRVSRKIFTFCMRNQTDSGVMITSALSSLGWRKKNYPWP